MALTSYVMQPTPGSDLRRYASAELQKIEKAVSSIIVDSTDIRAALEAAQTNIDDLETADTVADLRLDALEAAVPAITAARTYTAFGAMLNSWVDYDATQATYGIAQYTKDTLGFVHLRGLIRAGVVGAQVYTMPIGYRPNHKRTMFAQISHNGASYVLARVDIDPSGALSVVEGANSFLSLDGITYYAG